MSVSLGWSHGQQGLPDSQSVPGFEAPQLPQQTQLVGAKGPAGISSQPILTPLHCIFCTWNGFQFFRHPAFPACISAVCFQRRIVAINVCRAVGGKAPPASTHTPSSPQAGARPLPYCTGPPCLLQVTLEGLFTCITLVTSHTRTLRLDKKRALCSSPNLSAQAKSLPGM